MTIRRSPSAAVFVAVALLAIAAAAILPGCRGTSDDSADAYVELLRWIPDSGGRIYVSLFSYDMLRDATGTELPADPMDLDAVDLYLNSLLLRDDVVPAPPNFDLVTRDWQDMGENTLTYLRFGPAHLDVTGLAVVDSGIYHSAIGRFDPSEADRLVRSCDECPLPLEVRERAGLSYYAWGTDHLGAGDYNIRYAPPAVDGYGRGGRMYLSETLALRVPTIEMMDGMLDAGTGATRSLADREDFALGAGALEQAGAYYAEIVSETYGPEYRDSTLRFLDLAPDILDAWNPAPGAPALRPYRLVGSGTGFAGAAQPYLVFVLYHATEEAAAANVELLQRRIDETESTLTGEPWTDRFTTVDITRDGKLVIAKLGGERFANFIYNGDPLLLHE